ncbi:CLUMA_CG020278, isoform A [Clunio marinus]|uniref:CLUMA_CG020278, isoform A n=1 Tax=Clunio marinus TaxID=568069 RepID=A0A1J1J4H4_9DIPT|nr:CLUMA_CG020278, isoform A [Clunio marinus]
MHVETAQVHGRFSEQFYSFIESSINENQINESLYDTSSNEDESVSTGDSSHSAPDTEEIPASIVDQRPSQQNLPQDTEGVETHIPQLTEVNSQEVSGSIVEQRPVQQRTRRNARVSADRRIQLLLTSTDDQDDENYTPRQTKTKKKKQQGKLSESIRRELKSLRRSINELKILYGGVLDTLREMRDNE